jgi:hypothetical protein
VVFWENNRQRSRNPTTHSERRKTASNASGFADCFPVSTQFRDGRSVVVSPVTQFAESPKQEGAAAIL